MAADESQSLQALQTDVEEELDMARSSHPEELLDVSPAEWLFDPTEVQREKVGLGNLLGAVEALENDLRPPSALGALSRRDDHDERHSS